MVRFEQNAGIFPCGEEDEVASGMFGCEGSDIEDDVAGGVSAGGIGGVDGTPCRGGGVVGCEVGFGEGFDGEFGGSVSLEVGVGGGEVAVAHGCY